MPTYYVDATGGNDGDDGLSPGAAWQTIAKVNGEAFVAGDSILFKRGETWVGTTLLIAWSGAANNPITLADYDSGAKPIIDGNDVVNCIVAINRSYLVLENIEATQGLDSCFQFSTCDNVIVLDCDGHDAGNDNLIFITGCSNCRVTGGAFYAAYQRVALTQVSGIEIADDSDDIVIEQVECYSQINGGHGITVHSHAATGMPTRITIQNSRFHDNAGHGIQILKQDNVDDTGDIMIIQDNVLEDNILDGIRAHKTGGATDYVSGLLVLRNLSLTNTQYAYYFSCKNSIIRYNVWRGRGFLTHCQSVNFYSNTMYFEIGVGLYPLYITGAVTNIVDVRNNITTATVTGGMMIGVDVTVINPVTIDYNLYYLAVDSVANTRWHWLGVSHNWANWLINSGQDANSPAADQDPLFLDMANGNFYLDHGSPALQVGTPITGMPFYGPAPDCGRWEMRWKSQRTEQELLPMWKFA